MRKRWLDWKTIAVSFMIENTDRFDVTLVPDFFRPILLLWAWFPVALAWLFATHPAYHRQRRHRVSITGRLIRQVDAWSGWEWLGKPLFGT